MTIVKTKNGDSLTLALDGRLDTTTAPELQNELTPAFNEAKEVILDFTKLSYVSSAGLRVLLIGQKAAKEKGAKQTLIGVSESIMEVFEMTGFKGILNIQ